MKLKQWLREHKQMTYAEYKALPEEVRWKMESEFRSFNRSLQIQQAKLTSGDKEGGVKWTMMSKEEWEKSKKLAAKEKERYEANLKIGGIDERGNYTALHHRWF